MTPKEFYKSYIADDTRSALSLKLTELILSEKPGHVFEFGCGTGKNLLGLGNIVTCGLDISQQNILIAKFRHDQDFMICGDETHLGHLCGFDIAITCSVLDHIESIDQIIAQLKRMVNKTIFLAETTDVPAQHYFKHGFESYGFEKIKDFTFKGQDGANYYIWKWTKKG